MSMSHFRSELATHVLDTKSATIADAAVGVSVFGFSADTLARATRAVISCRDAGVMLTWSGVVPTATLGHLAPKDCATPLVGTSHIAALQFIREAAVSAVVTITLES